MILVDFKFLIPDESMGNIKLTGLGYDAEPNYEDNLKGLNAGYLNYSKIFHVKYQSYLIPFSRLCCRES